MVVWPVGGMFDEAGADWVVQDVTAFCYRVILVAQAVVKETWLPVDVVLAGCVSLPIGDGFFHPLLSIKVEDAVQVVGHG